MNEQNNIQIQSSTEASKLSPAESSGSNGNFKAYFIKLKISVIF